MQKLPKLRITQSLLSDWLYVSRKDDGYEAFLKSLNREPKQPTKAMLDGTRFEGCVNGVLDGNPIDPAHEWYRPVMQLAGYLEGSQKQVTLFREVEIDGTTFLLHGVLDFLRAGVIYDTKFSTKYHLNKYLQSPQHPMYLALVPEARRFEYLICDGEYIYRECYPREITEPIEPIVYNFMQFLKRMDLLNIYIEKWRVNEA